MREPLFRASKEHANCNQSFNIHVNCRYMTDYAGPVASSVHRTTAQNSQREGRSLPRQGRDNFSQWGMGIRVGFFTETTSFLRYPGVRGSPSYV